MKQYVRCKVCGYVMEASKLREFCPACGVSAKAFEPYEEKISEKRKKLIDLHLHPIVVHLAQAMAPLLVALAIALFVLGEGTIRTALLQTTLVLAVLLPPSVVLAIAAGIYDAKLRFKKVSAPLLVKKIVVGSSFFVLSVCAAVLALLTGLGSALALGGFGLLELGCLVAAVKLGNWGFGLIFAKMPG